MANEAAVVNESQVDLNNNNNNNGNQLNSDVRTNGLEKGATTNSNANGIKSTSESDDLILKLKRIILQQEKDELDNRTTSIGRSFVVTEIKETPKLVKNLMTNGQLLTGTADQRRTPDTVPNGRTSNSRSLDSAALSNSASDSNTNLSSLSNSTELTDSNRSLNGSSNRLSKSPIRSPNKSPLSEKKSLICKINKSPTPSRKMINQTNKLNNNSSSNNNGQPDEPQIRETIKIINDKAIDKVNELNKTANGLTNGAKATTKLNGSLTGDQTRRAINQTETNETNETNKTDQNVSSRSEPNSVPNKSESTDDASVKRESIKIIQTNKSISTNRSNKIDQNNNVQTPPDYVKKPIVQKQQPPSNGHSDQTDNKQATETDKQLKHALPAAVRQEMTEIELIIRASNIDGKRKGADLFCQEYFMDLYLLAELNYVHLKISTVDLKKPPSNFRNKFSTTKPPILLVKIGSEQLAILENEKIERYIMKNIPGGHLLFVKDAETAKLIENLYSKFKLALSRNEVNTKQSLLKQLEAIDKHLAERKTKFITGADACCFDFELISKLQHIRIAGGYFIDEFEIPTNLVHLWKYMDTMYHLNAFVEASPDDQTIISHYLNSNSILINRASPARSKQTHLELQKPCTSILTSLVYTKDTCKNDDLIDE